MTMTKKKTTKRALLTSVLSLLLCVSMLIGSTFAWFTDTATTGVNKIQSGTLDVALVDGEGKSLEGEILNFVDLDDSTLWEPGCTYRLPEVFVKNNGNLALKYMIVITGIDGDAKLNEVIDWTVQLDGAELAAEYKLAPGETSKALTISGHMKEEAGNAYQGLTIDGISITVYATQDTVEYDSTTDQYDEGANLPVVVKTQTELNEVIANANDETTILLSKGGYNILLKNGTTPNMVNKNITFSGNKDVVMDLTGIVGATWHTQDTDATLTFDGVTVKWNEDNEGYQGFANAKKVVYKNCTIYGTQFMGGDAEFINCVFEAANTAEQGYAVYGRGAGTLEFTDCIFNTDGRAIMLYQDQTTEVNVVMDNCVFIDNGNYSSKAKAVVETGDGQNKTSKFNITIKNSIACGFEANGSNSVFWGNKDGIGNDRLTVTESNNMQCELVTSGADLDAAIATNDTVQVYLTAGTYKLNKLGSAQENIMIAGSKDVIIDMSAAVATKESNLAFRGVTVKFDNNANYTGFQHTAQVAYKDCTIIGQQTMYAPKVEFVDCVLENTTNAYCVWTYGATNATFKGCTFNTAGKAILVYTEGETHANITVDNCIFNDNDAVALKKAAVEVGSSPYSDATTYDITINDSTVNGFAVNDEGTSTNSTYWGNKNSMDQNHLNVMIDGVEVY